jgi:hypothetical protein
MLSAKLPAALVSKFKLSKTVQIVEGVVVDEELVTFDILETSLVGPVVTRKVGCWVVASVELLVLGCWLVTSVGLLVPVVDIFFGFHNFGIMQ